ncbi:hyalin-like, partial [Anneissia japonica]|uniref:hyalin-like n=1 Tax=Anneissia japonica TaxID=1529436 RepID=UPI0014255986
MDNVQVAMISTNYTDIDPTAKTIDAAYNDFETTGVFPVGETIIEYIFTDSASPTGNEATCYVTIVISDFESPVFTECPSSIYENTGVMSASALVNWSVKAMDNSGEVNVTSNFSPPASFQIGLTIVLYVATDNDGNTAECEFNITISDMEEPVIYGCLTDDVTINTTSGQPTAEYTWPKVNASDNSGSVTLYGPVPTGNTFNIGANMVSYLATDDSNNFKACMFTVTVTDVEAPVIENCPGHIIEFAKDGGYANVSWVEPIASDNSMAVTLVPDKSIGSSFQVGSTIVTYTASDKSGNQAMCTINVTVF